MNTVFKKIILSTLFLNFMFFACAQSPTDLFVAPSQLGITGLIYTPSAYTPSWPTVDVGYTHFTKGASLTYEAGESPERTFLANIVFLPSVELSLKLTRPYSNIVKDNFYGGKYYGIGDRSISLRVQILKEKKYRPAILIGIQDPFANLAFFSTNYIVLSKKSVFKEIEFATTIGYGWSIEYTHRYFLKGPFGGIQVAWNNLSGLVEYDTERLNIGMGYQLKDFLFFKVAMINGRHFTGTINVRFKLKP